MLYQLLLGRHLHTIPTLGHNHETITADGMELDCWDIGGLEKVRHLWPKYSAEADGIIFVVDSADRQRFEPATMELHSIFNPQLKADAEGATTTAKPPDAPLLVLANKQDLGDAADVDEIKQAVRFDELPCEFKHVAACSALDLPSLQAGVKWMTDHFRENNVQRKGRQSKMPRNN